MTIFVGGVQIDIPAGETIQLDVEPPELTVPDDFAQEAQSPAGSVVEFEATATDNLDPAPAVVCVPASETLFPFDDTIVECTATDFSGNAATKTFTVTVQDTTPPELTVPSDVTIDADDPFGSIYTILATATDDVDPAPTVECVPPSGSVFPIGTTTVSCTATDASGNESIEKTFDVTVQVTSSTFDGFVAKIESLGIQKGIENSLTSKINAAVKSFEKGKTDTAINQLEAFINEVDAQDGKKLDSDTAAMLRDAANLLIANL